MIGSRINQGLVIIKNICIKNSFKVQGKGNWKPGDVYQEQFKDSNKKLVFKEFFRRLYIKCLYIYIYVRWSYMQALILNTFLFVAIIENLKDIGKRTGNYTQSSQARSKFISIPFVKEILIPFLLSIFNSPKISLLIFSS